MSRLAELEFGERGDVVVVAIVGELDLSNVHDIGDALGAAVGADAAGLVLDLSRLTHLDSAGIRLLFDVRSRLARARQALAVAVPDGAVIREVLELAAVAETVGVQPSVEAAVAAVKGA